MRGGRKEKRGRECKKLTFMASSMHHPFWKSQIALTALQKGWEPLWYMIELEPTFLLHTIGCAKCANSRVVTGLAQRPKGPWFDSWDYRAGIRLTGGEILCALMPVSLKRPNSCLLSWNMFFLFSGFLNPILTIKLDMNHDLFLSSIHSKTCHSHAILPFP